VRVSVGIGVTVLMLGLLFPVAARAQDDDTKAELEALKKRVAELEKKANESNNPDDSLRKAVERISEPGGLGVKWNNGLWFETDDKAFSIHVGATLQYDFEWFHTGSGIQKYKAPTMTSALGNQADGDEARRMRLLTNGTIYGNTFYMLEADFAGRINAVQSNVAAGKAATATPVTSDTVQIARAYVGTTALQPFATVTVGHLVEPFNLETVTNSNFNTFMERSTTFAFTPQYQTGMLLSNAVCDQRATWAIGEFRTGNGNSSSTNQGFTQADSGYDTTARVTGLPWYQDEKNGGTFGLLHLGAAGSMRYPTKATSLNFYSAPEMHLASYFVNTAAIAGVHEYQLYDQEAAFVYGPFSAQGECAQAEVTRTAGQKDVQFGAAYGFLSYFLTGEHRGYNKTNGCFDWVHPLHNLGSNKDGRYGWGAWELAARYSYIDLNDGDIQGGRMADVTAGLNWYLNPNVRVMLNYVRSHLFDNLAPGKRIDGGDEDIFGVRFQVDL